MGRPFCAVGTGAVVRGQGSFLLPSPLDSPRACETQGASAIGLPHEQGDLFCGSGDSTSSPLSTDPILCPWVSP